MRLYLRHPAAGALVLTFAAADLLCRALERLS
jgi:hypothetical protein